MVPKQKCRSTKSGIYIPKFQVWSFPFSSSILIKCNVSWLYSELLVLPAVQYHPSAVYMISVCVYVWVGRWRYEIVSKAISKHITRSIRPFNFSYLILSSAALTMTAGLKRRIPPLDLCITLIRPLSPVVQAPNSQPMVDPTHSPLATVTLVSLPLSPQLTSFLHHPRL